MRLIGMLDSPYVRRVAISLRILGQPFSHEPLSVFRSFDEFAKINPAVKAPTLVTDDGIVMMDSSLILQFAERLANSGEHLTPTDSRAFARCQRIVGLALAACEKTVQIVYERSLRPVEKQHQPWLDRISTQLSAAYRMLEDEAANANPWFFCDRPLQSDITTAVAWRFTQEALPGAISLATHPALTLLSNRAEAMAEFLSFPPA
jgi:glutathione S-transferase